MKIKTTRFGEIEVADENIVNFRDGMIGFSKLKRYFLVESQSMPLIIWMQSVDAPEVAFPLVEPWFFKKDYKPNLTEADRAALGLDAGDRTKLFVVLTIPEDMTKMTANMKAPVVVDIEKGSATQLVLQEKAYEVRTPVHEAFNRALANLAIEQSASSSDSSQDEAWSAVDVKGTAPAVGAGV